MRRETHYCFGCGGERDKGKRKGNGRAKFFLFVNGDCHTDNPRNENLFLQLLADILEGVEEEDTEEYVDVEPDRELAIREGNFPSDCW